MKVSYLLTLLFAFLLAISSCTEDKNKMLRTNKIYELKYLNEYAQDYCGKDSLINVCAFNFLYNGLILLNLGDSIIFFISVQGETDFFLKMNKENIIIYRAEFITPDSPIWSEEKEMYHMFKEKIENKSFNSMDSIINIGYIKRLEHKLGFLDGTLTYELVMESKSEPIFIYYQYNCNNQRLGRFVYDTTIKNDFFDLKKYKVIYDPYDVR